MKIPKNMTEEEVIGTIEKIVGQISGKFRFGSYTIEDIRQEAWRIAIEGLDNYDGERRLENFLRIHIRNRLFNGRRKTNGRYQPPCKSCPLYNKGLPSKCSEYSDRDQCDLYSEWSEKFEKRQRFNSPTDISALDVSAKANEPYEKTWQKELIELVRQNLPAQMMGDFLRFLDGVTLNKTERRALLREVCRILENYGYGGDET